MSNLIKVCLITFAVIQSTLTLFAQDNGDQKVENPIGKFFRNLNKEVQEGAEELEKAQQGRDQIDSRPPQNQDAVRRLEQARQFLGQQRWHDAVGILQFLIESENDSFLFNSDREPVSLHGEVTKLLSDLPEGAKRNYLNRFAPAAGRMHVDALKLADCVELQKVSRVYPITEAGQAAMFLAAVQLRDEGQLIAASRAFAELVRTTSDPEQRLKHAQRSVRLAVEAGDLALVEKISNEFSLSAELAEYQSLFASSTASGRVDESTQLLSPAHEVDFAVDPQFLPIWSKAAMDRYIVEEQIRQLFHDLEESGRAMVGTGQALLHAGMIAYRTLRGLEVREGRTGRLLWEHRLPSSPEIEFTATENQDRLALQYRGRAPENHALTSLLLRDGISRSLTTDGRHLFAIEGHELFSNISGGYAWQRQRRQQGADDEKWSTNEIVAYDFETGRVRWRVGGKQLEEPFSRPLAGTFFFGPPVQDGADLYVIGEREGVISLYTLNPQSGELLWSQEIAIASRAIADDPVRRFWPCYPVIKDGVILCPTTCGWLVAVDRNRHDLLWASRYSPRDVGRNRYRREFSVQSLKALNERWSPMPPVVVGNRVLVMPAELPNEFGDDHVAAFCFDVRNGALLWKQDKDDNLYLAGIDNGKAIFVGRRSVIAREIDDSGSTLWEMEFDDVQGNPSGRSVIINHQLLIPVAGKQMLHVDLETGAKLAVHRFASSEIDLGHLYYADRYLFSVSAFNTTAFPIRQLTEEERVGLEQSFAAELVGVESLLVAGEFSDALEGIQDLRSRPIYQVATRAERERIDELEWTAMERIVLTDEDRSAEMLLTMQTLAETSEELARYKRLAADRERRDGNWQTALRYDLSLLEQTPPDQFFIDGTRRLRVDAWVGGRIQDLYENGSEESRRQLAAEIDQQIERLRNSIGPARLARVFHYLESGQQLELELATSARNQGRLAECLMRLKRVAGDEQSSLASTAWIQMAEVFVELDAVSDARQCWLRTLELPSSELPSGQSTHAVAQLGLQQLQASSTVEQFGRSWGREWEVVRTGAQGRDQNLDALTTTGEPFEFLRRHRFLFQKQNRRLQIEALETGEFVWSLPLRTMSGMTQRSYAAVQHAGAMSYVVHQGAIHALQFPDCRVAWTYTPVVTGLSLGRLRSPSANGTSTMSNPAAFRNTYHLNARDMPSGILMEANEFCVFTIDEEMHALDALTGEVLWSESNVSRRTMAEALHHQFFIVDGDDSRFVRFLDGKSVDREVSDQFAQECLQLTSHECVRLKQSGTDETTPQWTLLSGTLQEPKANWNLTIDPGSLLVKLDEKSWGHLMPDGEFFLIHLADGRHQSLGKIPDELLQKQKKIYAYSDRDHVFVVVAHGNARTSYSSLKSLRDSGTLLSFSKQGGLLWSQATEEMVEVPTSDKPQQADNKENDEPEKTKQTPKPWSMNLIVEQIHESPLLLFISDRPENRDKVYFRRLLMVGLDKQTGERLFEWNRISNANSFSYLHVDLRNHFLDLRTYNERLKIRPVQAPVAATDAGEKN